MSRIQPRHIAAARQRVEPLCLTKANLFADAVFASQPNLLASVLVLPRFGVSSESLDVALKILFICHEAVRETGFALATISESDQERCLARVSGKAGFLEELDARSAAQAASDQLRTHPEQYLLAAAYGLLMEHDLASVRTEAEKYLVLAVLNIVETISDALTDTGRRAARVGRPPRRATR